MIETASENLTKAGVTNTDKSYDAILKARITQINRALNKK
mgnify:CR=1 FL=1